MIVKPLQFTSLTDAQIRKFWAKVDLITEDNDPGDSCWPWNASTTMVGQGKIRINKVLYLATRVGWFITYGADPFPLHVLHTCDNWKCCRPSHWFLGTNHENILDRNRKDRGGRKLTTSVVLRIKAAIEDGNQIKDIAETFGVTPGMICHIRYGRAWLHVD